jgi:hypothetical protein
MYAVERLAMLNVLLAAWVVTVMRSTSGESPAMGTCRCGAKTRSL